MAVSEAEVESEIRSKVKGEDIIRAWIEEGPGLENLEKMSNREYMEYMVDLVSREVPEGLRVPSEYVGKAFDTLVDILDETIAQKCRRISWAESERKRAEAWLYECRLSDGEDFFVVKLRVNDVPYYIARSMKTTRDRWRAHDEFRNLVETELA